MVMDEQTGLWYPEVTIKLETPTMKYKKHPILELDINENGSSIVFNGKIITPTPYKDPAKNFPIIRVNFGGRHHQLAKLICEAWHGMRENMTDTVCRLDKNPENYHYTNLAWGKRPNTVTARTKRSKLSKIKPAEIPSIVKRLQAGETIRNIAKSLNCGKSAIGNIKDKYVTNKVFQLKQDILKAKDSHGVLTAYAHYYGFKNLPDALSQMTSAAFHEQVKELALTL